ncbi:MAG: DegT/DnrJ/EryC1/StrS family aminotransferase [bacterium]
MIPLVKVAMPPKDLLMPALEETLYSGMIAEGEVVYRFEAAFADKFKLPNALSMSSGTAALHTSLVLAGVRPGDEVISTPMTAEPTNLAILHSGASPVWADVSPLDGTIDPQSVRDRITSRTRAIMVVHYAGYPARMDEIMAISEEKGVPVIEDCAHALGASYDGLSVGSIGDYGIFSFQAIKHMTTVDGGALVLKDAGKVPDAKKFRWFGMLKGVSRTEVDITAVGYKYNMTNVGATLGLSQLSSIESLISRHVENGRYYDAEVARIPGFSPARFDPKARPTYWLYTLLCDDAGGAARALESVGVMASKLHKPNNLHSIFRSSSRDLPGLASFYDRLLHIPCGWWVDDETRQRIVETLHKG